MSILMNKDKTELIVTCNCGCGDTVHIRIDKEDSNCYAIANYLNSNWYRDQDGAFNVFKDKLKKIWSIIRNKDYYYSDIFMTRDDFLQFKEYINSIDTEG